MGHAEASELLGAHALDACEEHEAAAVEAHVAACPLCREEAAALRQAAGWLSTIEGQPPPPGLGAAILDQARNRRRATGVAAEARAEPPEVFGAQIDELHEVLAELRADQWASMAADPWTAQDLVAHLTATETVVADLIGVPSRAPAGEPVDVAVRTASSVDRNRGRDPAETARDWWEQVGEIRRHVSGLGPEELDRRVDWLGLPIPLRRVLVGRAFETWIHTDDIRRAVGKPAKPPAPRHMHEIADLAVRSLPAALRVIGRPREGATVRVVLTGDGGGEWTLPLGRGEEPGTPDAVLFADVVEFCYLAGGRLRQDDLRYESEGDRELAADLVLAAPAFSGP